MRDKNLTFLLVESESGHLEGIFTLKDVVKSFDYMAYGDHLKKPVSVAMSRPVKTINANQLHEAAEIMLNEGIRHLPVKSAEPGEESRILGVVDMESLLRGEIEDKKKRETESREISVFSPNGSLLNFIKSVLSTYPLLQVDKLWASKLPDREHMAAYIQGYDLFFLDIVDEKALKFAETFGEEVSRGKKRMVALVMTEQFKKAEDLQRLKKIVGIDRVRVFEKPITVHDVIYECLN
jgi:CBS domain-containing protein